MNTTSNVSYAIDTWYDRTLLERANPNILHHLFGMVKDLPKRGSNRVKFRKYGAFANNTTPLTEGVTPAGKDLSVTDVYATVRQYGDFVMLSDFLLDTSLEDAMMEASEVLGEQAGNSLDEVMRETLVAGTSVRYAGGQVSRGAISSSHKLSDDLLRLFILDLKDANAPRITKMVNPSEGYDTTPVDATYVAIVSPRTTYNLKKNVTNFVPIEKYFAQTEKLPGEVGKFEELRFIESTQAKTFTGEGSGGVDVACMLAFGARAYGVSRLSGEALKNIRKGVGSAGSTDPLDQRATSAWKATLGLVITQQLFMNRLEFYNE